MPGESEFITANEAAQYLGYEVQHVRRLLRQGKLDGEKVGRDWIVRRESIARYVGGRANLRLPLDSDVRNRRARR